MSFNPTTSEKLAHSLAIPTDAPLVRDEEIAKRSGREGEGEGETEEEREREREETIPSALPDPVSVSSKTVHDEHLGRIPEVVERFSAGEGAWLEAHWAGAFESEKGEGHKHLRQVEILTNAGVLTVRRGEIEALRKALDLASYIFETQEREELARRTC